MHRWLAVLLMTGCTTVYAQGYPTKPIKLIVPFPPGGPTDIVARPLALQLTESLKQPVIIENRAGAGGGIGAEAVVKSPADGYTLLVGTTGTQAINATLYKKLAYDPIKDFTPIAHVASAAIALVAHPSQAISSVADLIAAAKKVPGNFTFGSAGNGTPGHLTGEMFRSAAGIDIKHIPYRGSAPALTDLLGGQLALMFDPLQSVYSSIQAGKVKVLAISSAGRSSVLPAVPTFAEAGLANFEATAWWGVFGPANLPSTIADRLNSEIETIVQSAAFRDRLVPLGVQPAGGTRAALAQFQRNELQKWGKSVRDSGATVD
jgi:tripartite-type tricarboxylate transporter receptor subunit TctC